METKNLTPWDGSVIAINDRGDVSKKVIREIVPEVVNGIMEMGKGGSDLVVIIRYIPADGSRWKDFASWSVAKEIV